MRKIFVTGIGTDVGKTIVSAILVEKLKADYWKPVQSGSPRDTDTVKALVSNSQSIFHPEAYCLSQPFSPHYAARLDNVEIDPARIIPPSTGNTLIIEGAGGLMVPLNDSYTMTDLAAKLATEIVLVSRNYLGSINHTLLSAELLKQRGLPVAGIVFCGAANAGSEDYILKYTGLPLIGKIPEAAQLNPNFITECTNLLNI